MYSMPYYTYGSTANFLFLGPTALIASRTEPAYELNLPEFLLYLYYIYFRPYRHAVTIFMSF